MEVIRIGYVSAVDRKKGMVSVTYTDKDKSTTDYLPYLSFGKEYKMPDIKDMVLIAHLSNGMASAVVIGGFWNKSNKPEITDSTGWKKFISKNAYMDYNKDTNTLTIHAPRVVLSCRDGTLCLNDFLKGMM